MPWKNGMSALLRDYALLLNNYAGTHIASEIFNPHVTPLFVVDLVDQFTHMRVYLTIRDARNAHRRLPGRKSESIIDAPIKRCANKTLTTNTRARHYSSDFSINTSAGCSRKTIAPRVEIRKAARGFNLQLHTRVYLTAYVRYLCRIKSHLCRSQNKLLIIEIRRISLPLSLSLPSLSLFLSLVVT